MTLIATALALSAAPATGAPAPIRILSVSAENVKPGDTVRVRFRVTNDGDGAEAAIVVVGGGLRCATGCRAEPRLAPGRSRDFEAALVAPKANPGEITGLNISVAVRLGEKNSFDHKMVYVHGSGTSSAPATKEPSTAVNRVSGRVRDSDGKAIGGATLTVRDTAGHEYRTTSNGSGRFSIRSSAARPIVAGRIAVAAAKDGYRAGRTTVQGVAGDSASAVVTLAVVAAPTTTSPSPDADETPLAADEAPQAGTSLAAAPPTLRAVSDEGSSSLLFTLMGGLLVVVGLGGLVLVIMRRRNAADDRAGSLPTP